MVPAVQFSNEAEYSAHYPTLSSDPVTTHCATVEDFLTTLQEISPRSSYIFRGQNYSYFPIIATLFRPEFIAKRAIDAWFDDEDEARKSGEYYDRYIEWEEIIVRGFANNCMNEGIPLPYIPYSEQLRFDTETVSAYFVARNYGVPNRLLDFTRSPVIGAWFAANGSISGASNDDCEKAVVWAISRRILSEIGYTIVSTSWSNAQIPQMQRQKAILLTDTQGRKNFLATGKFQPMEYMIEQFLAENANWLDRICPIKRVTLPQGKCANLMHELRKYELSEVHLFPTLDIVAKNTVHEYSQHANYMTLLNKKSLKWMTTNGLPFIQT